MRRLIEFIIAKKQWFLFFVLEALAFLFIFRADFNKKSIALSIHNELVGTINNYSTKYSNYINLIQENEKLLSRIAQIEGDYLRTKQELDDYIAKNSSPSNLSLDTLKSFNFVTARVIMMNRMNDNIAFVINKGSSQGLRSGNGVLSVNGVVGSVLECSENYSIVIPLINPKMQLSVNVKNSHFIGSLSSSRDRVDETILTGVPKHSNIKEGDTIMTSGYSDIFPRGLIVGKLKKPLDNDKNKKAGHLQDFGVELFTNFNDLSYVYVILSEANIEVNNLLNNMEGKNNG